MKRILTLTFCVTILFSTICLAAESTNYSKSQSTTHSFPNIFRPIGDLFKKILRIKPKPIIGCRMAEISESRLDKTEYILGKSEPIQVYASVPSPDADVLDYRYTVSGGKIIGTGQKVIWDLVDVKAGNYTITAEVDNGCNFCGRKIIKMVSIKLCPDCK